VPNDLYSTVIAYTYRLASASAS